jgi:hypothetical protein
MDSFAYMSDEGIQAVLNANNERVAEEWGIGKALYPIEFSRQDFEGLVMCLAHMYNHPPEDDAEVYSEWAADFLSGIAETLGIEFI